MDKKTKLKGLAALLLVLIALGGVAYLFNIARTPVTLVVG